MPKERNVIKKVNGNNNNNQIPNQEIYERMNFLYKVLHFC